MVFVVDTVQYFQKRSGHELVCRIFGFVESTQSVRTQLAVEGEWMTSVNGARYRSGTLTIPSLGELKERTDTVLQSSGRERTTLREVVANVQDLHKDPAFRNAIFQVASQCNLLEMVGPSVTPESGVTGYYYDRTQGPAYAIACGAGTVYRGILFHWVNNKDKLPHYKLIRCRTYTSFGWKLVDNAKWLSFAYGRNS